MAGDGRPKSHIVDNQVLALHTFKLLPFCMFCSTACSRFFGDVNIGFLEVSFGNGNFDYLF